MEAAPLHTVPHWSLDWELRCVGRWSPVESTLSCLVPVWGLGPGDGTGGLLPARCSSAPLMLMTGGSVTQVLRYLTPVSVHLIGAQLLSARPLALVPAGEHMDICRRVCSSSRARLGHPVTHSPPSCLSRPVSPMASCSGVQALQSMGGTSGAGTSRTTPDTFL